MRSYILGHKVTFFKRSDVKSRAWQVRMNIGGRSVVRSTGALNIHEAGRFAETLIRQLLGQPVGLPCSTTLSEAWSLFDRERFGTLGRNYDAALSFNQRMLDRGGLVERRIDRITKADVIEHLYAMAAGDTVSGATYGVRVRVFKDFLVFLRERGWLGFEPLFPFNANRAYRQHAPVSKAALGQKGTLVRRRPPFSQREIATLLSTCAANAEQPPRWTSELWRELHFYIEFLLYTGARPGKETASIRWRDIDLQDLVVRITDGKTASADHPRFVVAAEPLRAVLEARLRETGAKPEQPLLSKTHFIAEFGYLLGQCGMADGSRRTLYCLRHTYCTNALATGKISPYVLAKNVGNSVRTIERFYDSSVPQQYKEVLRGAG